jgi:hypothetical protein
MRTDINCSGLGFEECLQKAEEADMYKSQFVLEYTTFDTGRTDVDCRLFQAAAPGEETDMLSHLVGFGSEAVVVENERSSRCSMQV